MLELAGPLAVAALVLVAGGAFKLRDPGPTRTMIGRVTGRTRPAPVAAGLLAAVAELAIGVGAFLVGGRILAGIATVAFAVFAVVAFRLTRLGSDASCGCFGRHSGQATPIHVGVDVGLAVLALAAAVADAPGFLDARHDLPAAGLPFLALAALGAWFAIAAMTVLPEAMIAARRGPRTEPVRRFEIMGSP
jgi:hypothetical protein